MMLSRETNKLQGPVQEDDLISVKATTKTTDRKQAVTRALASVCEPEDSAVDALRQQHCLPPFLLYCSTCVTCFGKPALLLSSESNN